MRRSAVAVACAAAVASAFGPVSGADGAISGAFVAALMGDAAVAACVRDSGEPSRTYVAHAFDVRRVTLRSGERMTVATGTDPCLLRGQSAPIAIFERTPAGYRRVLDDFTIPGLAEVRRNGTALLPTHDTIVTILESAYVWNGARYVFSARDSSMYDVVLGTRHPYETPVRFARGTSSATLHGTIAANFGDTYVFSARRGQTVAIRVVTVGTCGADVALFGDAKEIALLTTGRFTGRLPRTGSFQLIVDGSGTCADDATTSYTVRLAIR